MKINDNLLNMKKNRKKLKQNKIINNKNHILFFDLFEL